MIPMKEPMAVQVLPLDLAVAAEAVVPLEETEVLVVLVVVLAVPELQLLFQDRLLH